MDRFEAMRVFTRVVERRSFTLAAQDLGLPRSTVTDAVKHLEARLGVRLLERTTRHVGPTLDGEAYHRRCLALIAEVEDAEGAFGGAKPKGLLRVDVQGTLARHFLMPALPNFFAEYPDVELSMSEGERWIDIVREGVDCVLRFGVLSDSDLVARRVAMLDRLTCASPDYLARFGVPTDVNTLEGHRMVGLRSWTTGAVRPMEFVVNGQSRTLTLPVTISVTGTESYLATAKLGLGLVQIPRFHGAAELDRGALISVLPDCPPSPMPVSLLYPRNRQLSPRVRAFLDWAAKSFNRSAPVH
jgi:DNA-binding transcriptional LysR family regulator